MPNILQLLMAVLFLLAATRGQAQDDDRYANWRAETPQVADEHPRPETPYQPIPDEDAQPAVAQPDWQSPPQTIRKLPFRFERAPAGYDGSRVVPAAAIEPARLLPKPSSTGRDDKLNRRSTSKGSSTATTSTLSVAGSVAVVIGLFLLVAWMARRGTGSIPPTLPRDALEVLGRKRFAGKQEMQLVRLGNKLVLLHVVPGHVEAVCEITDPAEVDRLTGICYQLHPRSSTRTFRETFDKASQERPPARTTSRTAARPMADKLDLSVFEGIGRRAS